MSTDFQNPRASARGAVKVNAFTARIAPIGFKRHEQARVLRTLPTRPHPFSQIAIEPAASCEQSARKRFGMRLAAI